MNVKGFYSVLIEKRRKVNDFNWLGDEDSNLD